MVLTNNRESIKVSFSRMRIPEVRSDWMYKPFSNMIGEGSDTSEISYILAEIPKSEITIFA